MNNENLRGGTPKPRRGRNPIPVSMPHSATRSLFANQNTFIINRTCLGE